MSALFTPLRLRGTVFANRAWMSPMCQYSSVEGMPTGWHVQHLVSRAVGGAGLVMTEATAVSPRGRITPKDAGLWSHRHADAYADITAAIREHGSVPGVQLSHAGRKSSTTLLWEPVGSVPPEEGGWQPEGPSTLPFGNLAEPRAMDQDDIETVVADFARAAELALIAGFEVAEIHAAHGYLLHAFQSPLSNLRSDSYGGTYDNRVRLTLRVAAAVREVWPEERPVFVRVSATDWAECGWTSHETVALTRQLAELGIDLIDVSTGGAVPDAQIPVAPGYQIPFAEQVRAHGGLPTAAVGLITEPEQAETILRDGSADAVFLGRVLLRDPYWPRRAAHQLGHDLPWPNQYGTGKWRGALATQV
ncbi:NADH:flavin oxidoreductase/NADH oxidase [Streptomyces shenzhenensis]|uniref:NADH:flavin oxidoreductase/NADH oxidase n=1 Tax=Streptomyces shenzhenensis TaxID=943815 RepID=UPI0038154BAF